MTARPETSRTPGRWLIVIAVWLAASAAGQAQAPEARPASSLPASTVQQLMQANLFLHANVIFAAQRDDPASIARDARPSMSTNPLTGLYGGWRAIENSGLAVADAADLLNVSGRVCANGKPVPVLEADWKAAVRALRESGLAVAVAARNRSQDRVGELTEQLTNTCSNCHRLYRAMGNPCVNSGAAPIAAPR